MKVWITSSSRVNDEKYLGIARRVAYVFSESGYSLVCGGVSSSMMKEVYDTFLENKRDISCVTLKCYNEIFDEIIPIYVDNTFDRTKKLYDMSDVVVFLPGGTGSLAEIFSVLEEYRTISSDKRLILYNEDGFYDNLISSLNNLIELGFNDKSILEKLEIVNKVDELKERMK